MKRNRKGFKYPRLIELHPIDGFDFECYPEIKGRAIGKVEGLEKSDKLFPEAPGYFMGTITFCQRPRSWYCTTINLLAFKVDDEAALWEIANRSIIEHSAISDTDDR